MEYIDEIKKDGLSLKNAPLSFRDNQDIVLLAVRKNSLAIQYASDRLKDNINVAKELVFGDIEALKFISPRLRDNEEFMIFAVKNNGSAIMYASDRLKNNYNVVKNAVFKSGSMIEYVSSNYKDNEEIALIAIKNSIYSYRLISDRLKHDLNFNVKAVLSRPELISYISRSWLKNEQFLSKLKDNGFNVSEYEADLKEPDENEQILEKLYLEICKKFMEQKILDPNLTKKKFVDDENINIPLFDSALKYIKDNNEQMYFEIKNVLYLNENKYLHQKNSDIEKFLEDFENDIKLNNGEIRKFNLVDYYHYFDKYDIPFKYQEFIKFINIDLDKEIEKKLRMFFHDNSISHGVNLKQEYEGKTIFNINGNAVEVSLEQKKDIIHLMYNNKIPNNLKVYKTLLKSYVSGKLELEYAYLTSKQGDLDEEYISEKTL